MNYIRQIIFEMRHQPLMTWLSIAGTAIAIFLIMSDFMIDRINMVEIAPESRRSRILYGFGADLSTGDGNSACGSLSLELARELYGDLDGVERVSYSDMGGQPASISLPGGVPVDMTLRLIDHEFFNIYDYTLEEGAPFSREESEAGVADVIITRSTADRFFGKGEPAIGKSLVIDHRQYTVTGVISDLNRLVKDSYGDLFVPYRSMGIEKMNWMTYLGSFNTILLLKEGVKAEKVRSQVESRYKAFNSRHKEEGVELVYHAQPWDTETKSETFGNNVTPDLTVSHRMRYVAYAILLLIPAINLSSMTRSRLRRRISEIGLRRAFGCTRSRIMADLLSENFIISILGGLIGMVLSILFIVSFSNYFVSYGGIFIDSVELTEMRPSLAMLFSWQTFLAILAFCFILNLLSAGIPAWKASFTNPAEAIIGHNAHK